MEILEPKIYKKILFTGMTVLNYTITTVKCLNLAAFTIIGFLAFYFCGYEAGWQLVVSLVVAYAAAVAVYYVDGNVSKCGRYILLVAAFVMSVGVTMNVYKYTVGLGGTLTAPILINDDSLRYYTQACEIYDGQLSMYRYKIIGLPLATAALWHLFGKSIVYALAMNVFLTLVAIILTGKLTEILLRDGATRFSPKTIHSVAMILVASVCYFLGHGMLMLKEPLLYVAVLLMAIPLAHIYKNDRPTLPHTICFVVGNLAVCITRTQLYFFFVLIIAALVVARFGRSWRSLLTMMVIATACYVAGTRITHYTVLNHKEILMGEGDMKKLYLTHDDGRYNHYTGAIGDYYAKPWWQRLLHLPMSAAVQFVVPFPWNFDRDIPFGYSQIYSHIAYPWYVVGGIIIFYFLFLWYRRGVPLKLWAAWVLACWLIVAYLYAGSISRYTQPFIPLAIPLAVYVISELSAGRRRTAFIRWGSCYVILMASGLIACYYIQHT